MEALALLLAFILGALLSPFIWTVLIPQVVMQAQKNSILIKASYREAEVMKRAAQETVAEAVAALDKAHKHYEEANQLNLQSQQLIQRVAEEISAATIKNLPKS